MKKENELLLTKNQWKLLYGIAFAGGIIIATVISVILKPSSVVVFIAVFGAFCANNLLSRKKDKAKIQLFAILGSIVGVILYLGYNYFL